ncbi:MAG TPA: transglutaminase-like domain-containing protein, partial [Candidatus Krumholzibacteria bacterium]|nr:transglutaminase-like domain-containing protein [Candidatus Krumholzibacteria bacterium]
PISMMMFTEEISSADGAFRRSRVESSLSSFSAAAVLEGDSVRYESKVGGATVRKTIAWDPAACSEALATERVRDWLARAAPETTVVLFDVSEGSFRKARMVRGETTTVEGVRLTAVDEYDDGADTPSSTTWYDSHGDVNRTLVRQLGIEIEIARVSQEELATIEIEPDFDIIRQSMLRCDNFPTPVAKVDRVPLRLDFPGTPPVAPMDGPNQKERSREGRSVTLVLTRDTVNRQTTNGAGLAAFLKSDRFIQSDAAAVRAVADSIRAAAHVDGWPLARAIAQWVNEYIADKSMEHGYASALDVLRSRSGDCTEHSLLTVALLRAAGIPARPVVGLAFGEAERAFVGHMWVEAYVDGWRTLDALDLRLDPIRLRVHAPSASESLGERDLMRAYGAIAGVTITALAVDAD